MLKPQLVLFSLALSYASSYPDFPDFPVSPVSSYSTPTVKSGLAVAAVPVEGRKGQQKYFGTDLRFKGLIPVFLVIENQTLDDSFLLKRDDLMSGPAGGLMSLLNPAVPSKLDKAVAVAGTLPTLMMGVARQAKVVRQNILRKELQSVTLSPGASAHGFVFVRANRGYTSRGKIQLMVPFARSGSEQVVVIDLVF